ncbi:MAG: hypothetical protein JWM80_6048 [Cyanobacteria bacterium RYN_339]|nr:hypothetical protein [Cyanobacteria bacterium RYN_339]
MKRQAIAILAIFVLTGCGHAPSTGAPVARTTSVARVAAKVVPAVTPAVAHDAQVVSSLVAVTPIAAAPITAAPVAEASIAAASIAAAPVAEAAKLEPAGDFARFLAVARHAVDAEKLSTFHVTGSIQRDQLLTAEIDGTVGTTGVSVVVTESNIPGAKGMAASWDAASPLDIHDAALAPILSAVPLTTPGSLATLLAAAASTVSHEEIVQRDGHAVAMFSFTGGPAAHLQVGFPVAGGLTTYVEGADHLSLVVSSR